MASASSIEAGKAFLKLYVDDQAFRRGLNAAAARMKSFGNALNGVGAKLGAAGLAIAAPLAIATKSFVTLGSEIYDVSQRTGATVESLSELKYAAEQSGTTLGVVEKAFRALQQKGIDPAEFDRIAAEIAAIGDSTLQAKTAMEIFGARTGAAILPLLKQLPELRDAARKLGITMSTEDAAAADRLGDSFDNVKAVAKSLAVVVGATLAPTIQRVVDAIVGVAASSVEWIRNNSGLITAGAALAAVLIVVGGALSSMGFALIGISVSIGALASAVGLLVSPFALTVAAVAAAVVAFNGLGQTVDQVVSFLASKFSEVGAVLGQTISAMSDALQGGDVLAAANVLWAGLKLAWLQGTENLRVAWASFKNDSVKIFTNLVFDIQGLWANMVAKMKSLLPSVSDDVANTFDFILTQIKNATAASPKEKLKNFAEFAKRAGGREKESTANLEAIEAERKARLDAIEANRSVADETRDEQKNADIKAAQEAAAKAREEFDKQRKNAAAIALSGGLGDAKASEFALNTDGFGAADSKGKFQFGGRGAEQFFGGGSNDIPKKQLDELKGLRRDIKKGGGIKVGAA